MSLTKYKLALLPLALATTLAACSRDEVPADQPGPGATEATEGRGG